MIRVRPLGEGFRSVWVATAFTALGARVTAVALPLLAVLSLNASAGEVGLLARHSGCPSPYLPAARRPLRPDAPPPAAGCCGDRPCGVAAGAHRVASCWRPRCRAARCPGSAAGLLHRALRSRLPVLSPVGGAEGPARGRQQPAAGDGVRGVDRGPRRRRLARPGVHRGGCARRAGADLADLGADARTHPSSPSRW